jgi:hypothetical protein
MILYIRCFITKNLQCKTQVRYIWLIFIKREVVIEAYINFKQVSNWNDLIIIRCLFYLIKRWAIRGRGSWIYNYICNQCLSSLMLWVRISIRARCTTLCDKVCQWIATGRWFSPKPPVSSTNRTDRHDITEILLKVALSTFKQTNNI